MTSFCNLCMERPSYIITLHVQLETVRTRVQKFILHIKFYFTPDCLRMVRSCKQNFQLITAQCHSEINQFYWHVSVHTIPYRTILCIF